MLFGFFAMDRQNIATLLDSAAKFVAGAGLIAVCSYSSCSYAADKHYTSAAENAAVVGVGLVLAVQGSSAVRKDYEAKRYAMTKR